MTTTENQLLLWQPFTLRILSLGAGVQSTALYLMSMRQDEPEHVPLFDYAIFADTQDEPRAVYDHLEWLKSLGGPPILTRTIGRLGDNLINGVNGTGGRFVSIPAYTLRDSDGHKGMTRRQCTSEYKTDVIERCIRRELVELLPGRPIPWDVKIIQFLGLSFDEGRRVHRVRGRYEASSWATLKLPLFDMEMTRSDCVSYLKDVCPERTVPRSACVFCPYHSNAEWRLIRDHDAEGWARCLEVDRGIRDQDAVAGRGIHGKLYLHRSCIPLAEVDLGEPETAAEQYASGITNECEGMCGL